MNRLLALLVIFLYCSLSYSEGSDRAKKLKKNYIITKNKLTNSEVFTRKVSHTLTQINKQMRKIRRKKNSLKSQSQGNKIKISELNTKIESLEKSIEDRRSQIAKQLRAMYKLSNLNQFMYILNAKTIHEIERNSKYLKMYSEADYERIISFSDDIKELNKNKVKLNERVANLEVISSALDEQNHDLNKKIKSKKILLSHLRKQKNKYFKKLSKIKNQKEKIVINDKIDHLNEIFGTDFFDKRGNLSMPVAGVKIEKFGVNVDAKFRNKVKNNGIFIKTSKNRLVRSVHNGKISFIGELRGLGRVIVIEHGDNYYTIYGNNKDVFVSTGQQVKTHDKLGSVNFSPYHGGYGAYFEIRYFTEPINPSNWFSTNQSFTKL